MWAAREPARQAAAARRARPRRRPAAPRGATSWTKLPRTRVIAAAARARLCGRLPPRLGLRRVVGVEAGEGHGRFWLRGSRLGGRRRRGRRVGPPHDAPAALAGERDKARSAAGERVIAAARATRQSCGAEGEPRRLRRVVGVEAGEGHGRRSEGVGSCSTAAERGGASARRGDPTFRAAPRRCPSFDVVSTQLPGARDRRPPGIRPPLTDRGRRN